MSEITLPTAKIKASHQNPKNLIIFSKPKAGKTKLCAELPNWLLLDLEDGSDYVDALKLKATSVEEITKIGKEIIKAGKPYDGIVVDTVTGLEQMCIPYAETLYSRTPMGKNWFKKKDGALTTDSGKVIYGNILNLPNGAGYQYLREAILKMIDFIKTLAPHIILLGHVKDTVLEKDGAEVNCMELDLSGKIKRIISSQSDAIAYLHRGKNNQNILSFKTQDDLSCGARPDHLKNQEFIISEIVDDQFITHWDKIYIQ